MSYDVFLVPGDPDQATGGGPECYAEEISSGTDTQLHDPTGKARDYC